MQADNCDYKKTRIFSTLISLLTITSGKQGFHL